MSPQRRGAWYAVGAYTIWGLLPIYWKWLHGISPLVLISHRMLWSGVLLAGFIVATRRIGAFRANAFTRRNFLIYTAAALLLAVNWLVYVWAVNAGFIVETSLGYFINPLLSVLLGVVFLRERLRPWQWVAIGLAGTGVSYLAYTYGALPWIALTLAASFAIYGLVKKTASLGSIDGLALETGILFLPALAWVVFSEFSGHATFVANGPLTTALLIGAGVVTTAPLLLFSSAARRIPLSLIGVLQYIAPTIQFLLGVLVYHEPITPQRLAGFGLVWVALLVFGVEGVLTRRGTAIPVTTE